MPRDLHAALKGFEPATETQARIKEYMLGNVHRLAILSLDDIADATGTSQPSVTRVMRMLGYHNSIEYRTAASLFVPGRLAPDEVRRAADLIRTGDDLYVYAPPAMDQAVKDLFLIAFPKPADKTQPLKPQIIAPRTKFRVTPQRFNEGDAALILALSEFPAGYDFDAECRNAEVRNVPVVLLQAVPFEVSEAIRDRCHVLSMGLSPEVLTPLAVIYLAAAVAEIRHLAQQSNSAERANQ
ncbi:hypothetical protein [Roseinatronobacter monicus]|uniref:RpiR family transcriptional regulator n=1 Tax=Roseinatronobacter monicus TaxID=393481 RepID=A0A543K8S2_9RHOB|nr:hypothetical protein [Roseinatronobacter monicus]TQM91490.1 RpiR family transcriptional regulator [Roseinatronobacter monicus]